MTNELIESLKDVFALATGATTFINELLKIKNTRNKLQQNDNGDSSQLAASGYSSQLAASGYSSQLAASGDSSQLAASGYYSQLAASGDYSQLAASGDYSQLAASGDSSQLECSGEKSVIAAIGFNNIAKAKKGSWITLSEYEKDEHNNWYPSFVKTEYVDGERIKEDTWYILQGKEFKECVYIDGIISLVIHKRKNIFKVKNLGEDTITYIVKDGELYSHGATIKEAKDGLLYKISNRDTSKYEQYTKETELSLKEAIEMYIVITGACERGTRYFVEHVLNEKKEKYTVQEVINLTQGQYNHNLLVDFFERA